MSRRRPPSSTSTHFAIFWRSVNALLIVSTVLFIVPTAASATVPAPYSTPASTPGPDAQPASWLPAAVFTRDTTPTTGTVPPDAQQLVQYVEQLSTIYEVPAVSFAWLPDDSTPPFAFSIGYLNADETSLVTTNTPFRLASLTKSLVAGLLIDLADTGVLSLDTPVFCRYSFPSPSELSRMAEPLPCLWQPQVQPRDERVYDISLRNLLDHKTGWVLADRDPVFAWWEVKLRFSLTSPPTTAQLMRYLLGTPLTNDPGTRYSYENAHFVAAGLIAEQLYGTPLDRLIADRYPSVHLSASRSAQRDPREPSYFCARQATSFYDATRGVCPSNGSFSLRYAPGAIGAIASPSTLTKIFSSRCVNGARLSGASYIASRTHPSTTCLGPVLGFMSGTYAVVYRTPIGVWAMTWDRSPIHDGPFDLEVPPQFTLDQMPNTITKILTSPPGSYTDSS